MNSRTPSWSLSPRRVLLCSLPAILAFLNFACAIAPRPANSPVPLPAVSATNSPLPHSPTALADTPTAPPLASPSPVPPAKCREASAPESKAVYLRVNQVGYLPGESKVALALTNDDLSSQNFSVFADSDESEAFTAKVGADRGAYGNFAHFYELDFDDLNEPGAYRHLPQLPPPSPLCYNPRLNSAKGLGEECSLF